MTFFDDDLSQKLTFRSVSSRVWRRLKIDRRPVFCYLHVFLASTRQNKRLPQDVQIRFWVHFRGLSRFKINDSGVSGDAFWSTFRRLSRFKICDFEVSWEAFWRPFRVLSRFKTCDFEVSWEAFWRPLHELPRYKIPVSSSPISLDV